MNNIIVEVRDYKERLASFFYLYHLMSDKVEKDNNVLRNIIKSKEFNTNRFLVVGLQGVGQLSCLDCDKNSKYITFDLLFTYKNITDLNEFFNPVSKLVLKVGSVVRFHSGGSNYTVIKDKASYRIMSNYYVQSDFNFETLEDMATFIMKRYPDYKLISN